MLKTKQYILIGGVAVLMVALYSLDIKGLVKEEEANSMQNTVTANNDNTTAEITAASVWMFSRNLINPSLASEIEKLEEELKNESGADALALQKQLAQKWEDVNMPAAAAFAYEGIATQSSDYNNWLITGDKFTEGYQNYKDTSAVAGLLNKAIFAYQKALELNPKGLDAQTGLGVAYVSGTQNPMQGIQMLLAVVKEEPKNIKANLNLGMFSMKSGQFQKAVDRFKTINALQPSPESWFYLATSYENLGQKPEAILAYQKSKELAADPNLSAFIDRKINELKN
jgi:cytochrome c-type biogenesis protein CcmH/NrfG